LNIITPISPEYKKLLRDNPKITDLKEFFADYVQDILKDQDENKKFVEKKDLEAFEEKL
jgi:GTP1/Obg family GTP-binding protein